MGRFVRRFLAMVAVVWVAWIPTRSHAMVLFLLIQIAEAAEKNYLRELDQAQNWEGILSRADSHLANSDSDPVWLGVKGYALQNLNRCSEAIDVYRKAITSRPDFPGASSMIGTCQLQDGRYDQAITTFEGLLRQHPDSIVARAQLVRALARNGNRDQARFQLDELRAQYPGMARTLEDAEPGLALLPVSKRAPSRR